MHEVGSLTPFCRRQLVFGKFVAFRAEVLTRWAEFYCTLDHLERRVPPGQYVNIETAKLNPAFMEVGLREFDHSLEPLTPLGGKSNIS